MIKHTKNEVYIDGMYYQYTDLRFYYNNNLIYQIDTDKDTDEDIQRIKTQLLREIKISKLSSNY
jgi:hypothetical protein